MKLLLRFFGKTIWVTYFFLTSLYSLFVFLPYTNYALIKTPPYPWIPWFAAHHAQLYWLAMLGASIGYLAGSSRKTHIAALTALFVSGAALQIYPILSVDHSAKVEFCWAVIALLFTFPFSIRDIAREWPRDEKMDEIDYLRPSLWAIGVALAGAASAAWRVHLYGLPGTPAKAKIELVSWSVFSHLALTISAVAIINLITRVAVRTRRPASFRFAVFLAVLIPALAMEMLAYLESSFSFPHLQAVIYAVVFTLFWTLYLLPAVLAFKRPAAVFELRGFKIATSLVLCSIAFVASVLPDYIGERDWNGILQRTLTIAAWCALAILIFRLPSLKRAYSVPATLAILIITLFSYKSVQAMEIFWAGQLGSDDYEIGQTMGKYAAEDFSFDVMHHLLGNAPQELRCMELCRILRDYTNISPLPLSQPVDLVPDLKPVKGTKPNIFIFVMDSMRPDYLGAYNPKVTFTPNLDAFARDSIVFRHAYSQYSGTTLSEPAIWAGLMLLHSRYPTPFSDLNNLEKLVNVNDYQMMVSYDVVLKQILSPHDRLDKLDTDKTNWRSMDACSTIPQLAHELDSRPDKNRPVFFYSQPMNVHQFAQNDRPNWKTTSWRSPGFNARISVAVKEADSCLGSFFSMLKARHLYDNSIIVIASDHGDATGAYGRGGHSITIYPEIMKVPLIIHVPASLRGSVHYNDTEIASLTDITPSIYYMLGYRGLQSGTIYGHSLFGASEEEVHAHRRNELFLASDSRAGYGLLVDNRFFYVIYDMPSDGELFDLKNDPIGERNIITPSLKREYDSRIIEYLKMVNEAYGYRPGVASLLAQKPIIP